MQSPIGFKELVMPLPFFHGFTGRMIYDILFISMFVFVIPALETIFYGVFLYSQIDQNPLKLIKLGLYYTIFNYFVMIWTVRRMPAQFILSLIGGLFMGVLMAIRERKGVCFAMAGRIGFAAGMSFWFAYMAMSTEDGLLKRKQPDYFFGANYKNIWNPSSYNGGFYSQ